MDGTLIYDIKPYVTYADSHPDARSGFVDEKAWHTLKVECAADVRLPFSAEEVEGLPQGLALDPRPRFHHDASRVYGMPFAGYDVKFRVSGEVLTIVGVTRT